jgi:hypothetical protein|tara:strand:- start:6647 stop:6844 length:198 start_codon:yes stop_codon:yes gene_type:complete
MGNPDDWKRTLHLRTFPYTGTVNNKKYLKDRAELFAKNGNGWWWLQGTYGYEGNGRKKNNDKSNK